ncbi:MAG: DUF3221 domain-containing protein [Clostridium sp.]
MKVSKNLLINLFILSVVVGTGLFFMKSPNHVSFKGTVISTSPSLIVVEPEKGSSERQSSDTIEVSISDITVIQTSFGSKASPGHIQEGDPIKITYNGILDESYPAKIHTTYSVSKQNSPIK